MAGADAEYGSLPPRAADEAQTPIRNQRTVVPALISLASVALVASTFLLGGRVSSGHTDASLAVRPTGVEQKQAEIYKPHIVFVLLDDVGVNDMFDESSDIAGASPKMKYFASHGIKLTRYYTEHSCTPGRTVVLTGKYTFTTGMQHSMVYPDSQWGLSSKYTTMGEALGDLGYATHLYGKWDVGHYSSTMWPTNQGFDSFYGMIQTEFDYNEHTCCSINGSTSAYDVQSGYDNSPVLENYYSMYMFADKAVAVCQNADPSVPQFTFLSLNGIHAPVSLPAGYENTDDYINLQAALDLKYEPRKTFASVMFIIDQQVDRIVLAYEDQNMWGNSVLIVTSDNGAPSKDLGGENGGSGYPYRGAKSTMFEGGLRVPAFIYSPLIPTEAQGTEIDTLFHGTDWLPTIVEGMAKGKADYADGVNQWDYITGATTKPPRTDVPLCMNYVDAHAGIILYTKGSYYKLFKEDCSLWYNPTDGSSILPDGHSSSMTYDLDTGDCSDSNERMYDLVNDPKELNNLYWQSDYAEIVSELAAQMCDYYSYDKIVDAGDRGHSTVDMEKSFAQNDGYIKYWQTEESTDVKYPRETSWLDSPFCGDAADRARDRKILEPSA